MQVLEETGFDVSKLLVKDEYIEAIFGQQRVRLYIIAGVKDDTAFAPLTKKEISVCDVVCLAPQTLQKNLRVFLNHCWTECYTLQVVKYCNTELHAYCFLLAGNCMASA